MNAEEFDVIHLGPVTVQKVDAPAILSDPERRRTAESYWQQAVAASGHHLFNGTFLNLSAHGLRGDTLVVHGHFDEYKAFYVHRQRPELDLGVRCIGVSAVTRVREEPDKPPSILFAVRGEHMTQYPGCLECVPSGTVDQTCALPDGSVDYESKAVEELLEEARLDGSHVRSTQGFAFLYDRLDDSYDLCCLIDVEAGREVVLAGFQDNPEYSNPVLVPEAELAAFLEAESRRLLPVSKGMGAAYLALHAQHRTKDFGP